MKIILAFAICLAFAVLIGFFAGGCGGQVSASVAAPAVPPPVDASMVDGDSHCGRCIEFYFSACEHCTCREVDSGTLVACGVCSDGDAEIYNALYSCVGVP